MTAKKEIPSANMPLKGKRVLNRNLVVFSFFLFLTFIFWYLNSIGKETEVEVRYPINYVNLPRDRVITESQPLKVNMLLKGPGYSLLKFKFLSNQNPIIIDLSKVKFKRVKNQPGLNYYIVTKGVATSLIAKIKLECEVISLKPDTLFFTFEKTTSTSTQVIPENKVIEVED